MPSASTRIVSLEHLRALLPKTAPEALGVEIVSADSEQILLRMPMSDRARQPLGLLHGGISMVLAETAASLHACWDVDLSRFIPVGIEINGSHIRSASEGHILARGKVIRRSSKLAVHNVEITHEESDRLLCLARVTNFYKIVKSTKLPSRAMHKLGTGIITSTQDVDRLEFDWGKIHFLSEPAVTGAVRFSFGIVELAAGKGHARHNHPGSEEIIYVLSGEGEQMVDDRPPVKVGPGASIYIPADVYHSTLNTGTEPMKLAVVYAPAGPERLLRQIPGCKIVPS